MEQVISSLSELTPPNPDVAGEIGDNITYFTNNKERMRYNQYRERGYHIGSGTVESACKHVVGQRLKQVRVQMPFFSFVFSGRMVNGIDSGITGRKRRLDFTDSYYMHPFLFS